MGLGLFGVPWHIYSLDSEVFLDIKPAQPPVAGARLEGDPNVATIEAAGSLPTTQWLSPGVQSMTVEGVLYASSILTDLRKIKEDLLRLKQVDPTLGRAPRVSLLWGDDVVTGFVTSLPMTTVGYWVTGEPREIAFAITVTEAPETSIEGVSGGGGETLHLTLSAGETFESLARRYLRDPLRGDLIRSINPKVSRQRETVGTRVKIYEREHPAMRAPVVPGAPCFAQLRDGTRPWSTLINDIAADRASGAGKPLRLLPELRGVAGVDG